MDTHASLVEFCGQALVVLAVVKFGLPMLLDAVRESHAAWVKLMLELSDGRQTQPGSAPAQQELPRS